MQREGSLPPKEDCAVGSILSKECDVKVSLRHYSVQTNPEVKPTYYNTPEYETV